MRRVFLIFILFIGLFFRLNNLNWDSNQHLHPDERFLTMVISSMKIPSSLNEYLDQKVSFLNPSNIGYRFYVYGHFPLILNKFLAVFFQKDNYIDITILGRYLSAFFDLLAIVFVFKISQILFDDKENVYYISLLSASFYSIFVLPIQLAHFFTVDSFLSFFMISSLYFVLRFIKKKNFLFLFLSALFLSLAFASKITAVFILPLLLILIFLSEKKYLKNLLISTFFLLLSYFFLRFFDPYYFESKNFLDPRPNSIFLANIKTLKNLTIKSLDNWYPPMIQWLSKNSFQHAIVNNMVFGMGLIQTIFVIKGMALILLKFKKENLKLKKQEDNKKIIFITLLWVIGFFVYQGLQSNPTLRYFIYLYPFFALFSGYGFFWFIKKIKKKDQGKLSYYILSLTLAILLLIWPLMFSSIYNKKHTRVAASEWIYKNLPSHSIILGESWDDPLPLFIENNYGKNFVIWQLPVFDPDTFEKWQKMKDLLIKADYYVLSSNRGWGSITAVAKKYPLMSQYYLTLLNNDCQKQKELVGVCYQKIKEFTSYPKIEIGGWKLEINDDWADEGFTVYDHPKVIIFSKK